MWTRLHPRGSSTTGRYFEREPTRAAPVAAGRSFRSLRAPPWRDAALVATVTVAAALLCTRFDVAELLRRLSAPWERLQLDELPAVLLVLAAGLTWFAARR